MKKIKVIRNCIGISIVIIGCILIFYSYIVGWDTNNIDLFVVGILGGFGLILISSALIDTPFRNGFDNIKENRRIK